MTDSFLPVVARSEKLKVECCRADLCPLSCLSAEQCPVRISVSSVECVIVIIAGVSLNSQYDMVHIILIIAISILTQVYSVSSVSGYPMFWSEQSSIVYTSVGADAILNCQVTQIFSCLHHDHCYHCQVLNLRSFTVSWIRQSDLQVQGFLGFICILMRVFASDPDCWWPQVLN